jgi:predicted CoA-binding protein
MESIIDASSGTRQDDVLRQILQENQVVAVVGLSPRQNRPSHRIATYLLEQGYYVIPVNPGHADILNQTTFADLRHIPGNVDLVDVFRQSVYVPEIVQQAVDKNVRVVWLQEGIIHHQAASEAASAGIKVVMDRCIYRDHKRLIQGIPLGCILSDFRIQQGCSLDEVAQRLGISSGELEALENSPDEEISPDMVKRIASAIEGE